MDFVYYNPNPKGLHTGDCVVRALAFFFGLSWEGAFLDIISWCIEGGVVDFNRRSIYNRYLAAKGFPRHRAPARGMTVREFCERFAKPGMTYIVSMHRHLTIVSGRVNCDIGDCSMKIVDGYWERTGGVVM